jgi:hypothetical protein
MSKFPFGKIALSVFSIIFILALAYFNILSKAIHELVILGLDPNLIFLILIIPFISLFISIARILIGYNVNAFHIPIVLIVSSFVIGLPLTIFIMAGTIIFGILIKLLLTNFHFHFISKLSLILSSVSIITIFLFHFLISNSIFSSATSPLLILYTTVVIALIVEKYLNFKITKNKIIEDLDQIFRTLLFCIFSFFLLGGTINLPFFDLKFTWLQSIITAYPETVFITLLLNILIGQYTGLRLDEIIRFRKLIFKK